MRTRRAVLAVVLATAAVLSAGCGSSTASNDQSLEDLQRERAAAEKADPSVRAVRICAATVVARVVYGWRELVGSKAGDEESAAAARKFDRTYLPGSPEYDSYLQRYQEGVPELSRQIKIEGQGRDDAITANTALVSEAVRQDCSVAYKQ
ncbi:MULTISPECIES: hypothetical protein [unclassified Streptomyces]|uniref:hypothetical protein n=1 Tax=unclassified Streptomyces TaxID=2593676 RepID=UPI0035DE0C5F